MSNSKYSKKFRCNINNIINVSEWALRIINTPEFQRMKKIQQLGLTSWVYPTATHTRFEHSLGVYDLAGKILEKIKAQYPDRLYFIPTLNEDKIPLTDKIIECIKIAGLCHDLGHGPFSHIFDDVLLSNISHPNRIHEHRSCLITEIICKRVLSDVFDYKDINFIKSIINPGKNDRGVLYQIVCNYLNGIDVDKFDYLARDSKNLNVGIEFNCSRLIDDFIIDESDNIVYPKHCSADIFMMFHSRYMMHKTVYSHKTVKLLEMMLKDIFIKVDPIFKISESIYDMNKFCQLTDDSVFNLIKTVVNPPYFVRTDLSPDNYKLISEAFDIYQNMISRNLYKQIIDLPEEDNAIQRLDIFCEYLCQKYSDIRQSDLHIFVTKCGFSSDSKKSPFDNIFFYDKKESNIFTLDRSHFSGLMNNKSLEIHYHLYCKNKNIYDIVIFELKNFP
ncbi:Hd phosphohydrolase domain protein [Saudi moumouvirus]|uniref:Putative HD domain-containing protein n=1 Tax=Moumouvirus sp. 'Monve' TaxID=1128131 RepID=H2EEF9_9VIRU|nr:putative HD domain-containing protein [Moumouvirus Monve]AQN68323.1 Hd phosphohydrolase domain protein [Saudi moumouvirus]